MRRTVVVWALAGFLIAAFWVLLSLVVPMWREALLLKLASISCPIVKISFALNFGVKWYWVIVTNAVAYALIGFFVEGIWRWVTFANHRPQFRHTS